MKALGILTTIIGIVTSISAAITRDEARSEFWGAAYANRDIIADAEITITIGIVVAVVGILILLAHYITKKQ